MKLRRHPSPFGLAVGVSSFRIPSSFRKLTGILFIALSLITTSTPAAGGLKASGVEWSAIDSPNSGMSVLHSGPIGLAGPTLTSIAPTSGERLATLEVIFTGTNFVAGATTVDMGPDITINSVTVNSPTSLTANLTIASNAALGFRDVSVTNPEPDGGTATLNNAFAVNNPAPVFSEVNPNVAGRSQTLEVVITGEKFLSGVTTVSFGSGVLVNTVTVNPANGGTELTANISIEATATLGFRNVAVSNPAPGGGTATFVNAFNIVNPEPVLTAIAPLLGLQGQTFDAVLTGEGFLDGVSAVDFGDHITINSITIDNFTRITANVTIAANAIVGARNVSVTNAPPAAGVGADTLVGGFTVGYNAPTFSNLDPANGNRLQTLDVVLNGSNFISGVTAVDFGSDITINSLTVNSATQLTANITIAGDAALGGRNVSVTNPLPGGGEAALPNSFTISNPPPFFTNLSPADGNREQTLDVIISGENFLEGVTSVSFGADIVVNATTINSASGGKQLTANVTIAHTAATGPRSVLVTNVPPAGGTATFANGFNVNNAPPQLTSITPAFVSHGQSVDVLLTGSHFYADVVSIDFGPDITINSMTVTDLTQISAHITVGLGATLGARDVAVTNAGPGGGTAVLAGGLTLGFPSLTISKVSPDSGSRLQTLNTVVSGSNFIAGATTVSFGSDIMVNTTTVDSSTQLTANLTIAANAILGPREVTVTNPEPGGGSASLTGGFTVDNPAPVLASLAPNLGSLLQTLDVVLTGENFIEGVTSVNFGAGIIVNSATVDPVSGGKLLTANVTIAAGATLGPRDVVVANPNPGGGSAVLAGGFAVNNPAPVLTSLAPVLGLQGQTMDVVLTGGNFISGVSSVSFGNGITLNSTVINSGTQITANVSIAANATTGTRDVTVTNAGPGGGVTTLTNGFTIGRPPVSLTSVNPVVGNRLQTLDVVLTGSNFVPGVTSASFGDNITINATTVNSGTQITASITITDTAATGPRAVSVSNPEPGSSTATLTNSFIVNNPTPELTNISPNAGSSGDTLEVSISGNNFITGLTTVSFGADITVNTITVLTSSQMTANISIAPNAALGTRTIAVTNPAPGGGGATFINGFTVSNPAPVLTGISPTSGVQGQTLNVIFSGKNFVAGFTTVSLGNAITVNSTTVNNDSQMTANVTIAANAATGPRNVSVTNPAPGGGSATLSNGFTVHNPAPVLTSVTPASASRSQTLEVVLTGENFIGGATSVNFGNDIKINTTTISSDTLLKANLTIAASALLGPRDVIVTNAAPGGGSAVLTDGFTVNNPAPVLTNVAPALGLQGQTLQVTLSGENFISGVSSVSFGDSVTVNTTTINSLTQITASITIAANATIGARDVTVTNAPPVAGGGTATLPKGFTIGISAPTLTSVTPSSGTRLQTLDATLTGANFVSGATSVNFGEGITINSTLVNSRSQITANITIASEAATGVRDIAVTNPEPGGGTAILKNAFTVTNPVPSLVAVTPNNGQRGQTLEVVMAGTNFIAGVTTAVFGSGIAVNTVTVNSPAQMSVKITIAGDAALGARDIVVSNPAPGGGSATLTSGFTIANPAPTLTSVIPDSGNRLQTLDVVLLGSNFISDQTTVSFGDNINVNSITFNSPNQMTVSLTITVDAALGARDVTVSNPGPLGGIATLENGFTVGVAIPTLTSLNPTAGNRGDAMSVVMLGSNFMGGVTTVDFGGDISVDSITVNSATQLTANIAIAANAALGVRDVSVTNPGGGTATLTNAFTVGTAIPTLTKITPASGLLKQTLEVICTGSNFVNGTTAVSFGNDIVVHSVTVSSDTQLTANITINTNAATGPRNVSVTNPPPGGGTAILADGFTVLSNAPTLTSVAPNTGIRLQTLDVVLKGANFHGGVTSVNFGSDITINSTTVHSDTQLTANITIAADAVLGPRDVMVTNAPPGGGTAILAEAFTVDVGPPTLVSISPTSGNRGQTLNVILSGSKFAAGVTTVSFGNDITVNSISVNPASGGAQLTASVTIAVNAVLGARDVSVTNPGPSGGTATLQAAFNVGVAIPTLTSISPTSGNRGQTLEVTLTGTNFAAGLTTVSFGEGIVVHSINVVNQSQMKVSITISAEAALGTRNVSATNPSAGGGTVTLQNAFTVGVSQPTLTAVAPAAAERGQTLDVVLIGSNFVRDSTTVTLGEGVSVNTVTFNSTSQITTNLTIASEAAPGSRDVSVTTPGGTVTLPNAFTIVVSAPTLTRVAPAAGSRNQTLEVVLTGSNFASGVTTVSFGDDIIVQLITVNSDTQLTANIAISANATLGPRAVSVTNPSPGGGTATLTNGFTVGIEAPTLTRIAPGSGNRLQTLDVVLTGTNFQSGITSVSFGDDVTSNATTVQSDTQLTVSITIGANAATGPRAVSVTNPPTSGAGILTDAFIVTVGAPTVAAITPTSARRNETLNVIVTGTNFFSGITSLSFGSGITVTALTVESAMQLTATIQIDSLAALGVRNVTATNPAIAGLGGGTDSLENAFTVNAAAPAKFLISGSIRTAEGTGVSGVVLDGLPESPMTDANGFYQISVAPGFSAEARPAKSGYTFDPPSRNYANVQSDLTGQDYTALVVEKSFAFPNPFNPALEQIQIRFVLKSASETTLKIMDAAGDVVRKYVNPGGVGKTGELFVSWDGRNGGGEMVANGIYFYVITTGSQERISGKIAVVR